MPFGQVVRTVTRSREHHFPVVDREGRLTGILSINDIREFLFEEDISELVRARDVATSNVVRVLRNDTLKQALEKMAALNVDELPVVEDDGHDRIVAMISKRDIVDYCFGKSGS
ncbi:MAG: CBS domain-containing protein [Deltaproteobacteria bacterium]|nr:CBS domain-containing protein [Deltaproteobacteria bacterium]